MNDARVVACPALWLWATGRGSGRWDRSPVGWNRPESGRGVAHLGPALARQGGLAPARAGHARLCCPLTCPALDGASLGRCRRCVPSAAPVPTAAASPEARGPRRLCSLTSADVSAQGSPSGHRGASEARSEPWQGPHRGRSDRPVSHAGPAGTGNETGSAGAKRREAATMGLAHAKPRLRASLQFPFRLRAAGPEPREGNPPSTSIISN